MRVRLKREGGWKIQVNDNDMIRYFNGNNNSFLTPLMCCRLARRATSCCQQVARSRSVGKDLRHDIFITR